MNIEKISDQWQTPQALFDELNKEFHFVIDLCATIQNTKCKSFYEDYLTNYIRNGHPGRDGSLRFTHGLSSLKNEAHMYGRSDLTCWMNPPYSNPKPFIEKAWEDSKHCKIVCLVKCDPSTKWWATFWDYNEPLGEHYCGEWDYMKIKPGDVEYEDCCPHKYIKANRPKPGCEVRFFPKRIKFDPPKGFVGGTSGPTFSSALVIMDRRGEEINNETTN